MTVPNGTPMSDVYDYVTLMYRLKAKQIRNKELESDESYVQMKDLHCIPNLMNDALLNLCLGKYRLDCPRKSHQPIPTCNQDIFYPTVP